MPVPIIYKIVNADESLIYVGSTTDFYMRKAHHKSRCNTNCRVYVYQIINNNGGWDAFKMIPIKEFPCENKKQLVIEEERIRKELNANLNKNKAYIDRKEYIKEYNESHKEEIKEYTKQYREAHKEERKAYFESHKEKIKEKQKSYYEIHKEEIKEKKKEYQKKYCERMKTIGEF